jgi:hypothetical protein
VIARSEGPTREHQPGLLGVYRKEGRLNSRPVYKHVLADSQFLYYWDYAPEGEPARWVAGASPRSGTHQVEAGCIVSAWR